MEIADAFAPDVDIDTFFQKNLAALHASRPGEFEALSDIPILVCVKFDDDRIFSISASKDGVSVEDDEAIDFPLATILGRVADWESFKFWVRHYANDYERRKNELSGVFQFTKPFAEALEKYDVVADISLKDDNKHAMEFSVVLNNYEAESGFKRFSVAIDVSIMDAIANGTKTPAEVAKGLAIKGDYAIAAELGALTLKFKP